MQNTEIRSAAQRYRVRYWEIAEALGVTDSTFSRWLRKELPPAKRDEILSIIERLKGGVA